jgi:hypothetical protein
MPGEGAPVVIPARFTKNVRADFRAQNRLDFRRSLNVSTPSIAKSRNPAASKKRSVKSSATARRKVTSAATAVKVPPKRDEPQVERVTKQERLLTLLGQAEGRASKR